MVNYWWNPAADVIPVTDSAFDALVHAVLNLRHLPEPTRKAWQALFEHFVFDEPEAAVGHIPLRRHGVLGKPQGEDLARWRTYLMEKLRQGR
jgi:hypothetical protein